MGTLGANRSEKIRSSERSRSSGLRPSHLQDALRRKGGSTLLAMALGRLCNLWIHGGLPHDHSPIWSGARLIPLRKKDDGVRPVAVGETLRRLVGKVLLSTKSCKAEVRTLAPAQVGVGIPAAAESVVMGIQATVDHLGSTSAWILLKIDMANAFNCVSREHFLKTAQQRTPTAYNYLHYAYTSAAPLYVGDTIIESRQGTHQGCPLGLLGFALGIQDIVEDLQKNAGLIWSGWYLDDGILIGSSSNVAHNFRTVADALRERGLTINNRKCEVWGPGASDFAGVHTEVRVIPWDHTAHMTV